MKHVANTIPAAPAARAPILSRLLSALLDRLTAQPAPVYCLNIPGEGLTGDYATLDEAEHARARLPYALRMSATICDADGNALAC